MKNAWTGMLVGFLGGSLVGLLMPIVRTFLSGLIYGPAYPSPSLWESAWFHFVRHGAWPLFTCAFSGSLLGVMIFGLAGPPSALVPRKPTRRRLLRGALAGFIAGAVVIAVLFSAAKYTLDLKSYYVRGLDTEEHLYRAVFRGSCWGCAIGLLIAAAMVVKDCLHASPRQLALARSDKPSTLKNPWMVLAYALLGLIAGTLLASVLSLAWHYQMCSLLLSARGGLFSFGSPWEFALHVTQSSGREVVFEFGVWTALICTLAAGMHRTIRALASARTSDSPLPPLPSIHTFVSKMFALGSLGYALGLTWGFGFAAIWAYVWLEVHPNWHVRFSDLVLGSFMKDALTLESGFWGALIFIVAAGFKSLQDILQPAPTPIVSSVPQAVECNRPVAGKSGAP